MKVDLEERSFAEQVKFMAAQRGYSLKTLGEEFNQRYGTNYVQASFSRKLKAQTFSLKELKQLGEILGFKVKFVFLESE